MEVSWIKLATSTFKDEKIEIIEDNFKEKKDTILIIWIKLLCLAGRENTNGVFMLTKDIPYDAKTFSTVFKRAENDVKLSLEVLEKFEMIERDENNVYSIKNWKKYQQSIIKCDGFKTTPIKKEKKQKEQSQLVEDIKELNESTKEKEVAPDTSNNKNDLNINEQILEVVNYWNKFNELPKVTKLTNVRKSHIKNRIEEHNLESCKKAIVNCNNSDFLTGYNNRNWKANFDWVFGSPNNFVKVLEGNYNHETGRNKYEYEETNFEEKEVEEVVITSDMNINDFFKKNKSEV